MRDLIKNKLSNIAKEPIVIHTTCWLFFIAYELAYVYYQIGSLERPQIYIVFYSINLTLFYLHINILNFTFNGQKFKYLKGFLNFLLLIGSYLIVKASADRFLGYPQPYQHSPFVFIREFFPRNIARAFYFILLATFYWAAKHIAHFKRLALEAEKQQLVIEKHNAELETQLTKARNAYLQQQINPHLIFNALNFVYNSAQKYSDDAAHCIWLLSEIMRFSLQEADPDGKIKLKLEVEQIQNLIALNRYRFREPVNLAIEIEGDFGRHKIIPLILLTLTENIFKHGNLLETDAVAQLKIFVDDVGQLTFYSRNLKKSKNGQTRERAALGLQNTLIRLNTFYFGRYELQIKELGEYYELTLTLKL